MSSLKGDMAGDSTNKGNTGRTITPHWGGGQAMPPTDTHLSLLQAILSRSPDGMAFIDPDLVLRAVNESFARQIDIPVDQMIDQPLLKAFPAWAAQLEQICAGIRETGSPFHWKTPRFISTDPSEPDVAHRDTTISPLHGSDGAFHGYLLQSLHRSDGATEPKQPEEDSARLAAIVESSDAAIIGKTLDGIITSWNEGAEQIYGYSASEVLGKPISIIVPPDRTGEITEMLETVRDGESVKLYDTVRMRKDGVRIDVAVTVSPIKTADGRIIGVSTIARDVSERRQADRVRNRLVAILEATSDFVGTADSEGRLLYHNRSARRMLGMGDEDDLSGLQVSDAHPQWARDIVLLEGIPTAIGEGTWSGETALLSRDGREIPISQVIVAHKSQDGTVEFLSTIARDITERKLFIEQLSASALAAQEAAELEQTMREELEVQNEEIQGQNEEIQSRHEELHVLNEELRLLNQGLEERVRERTEELEQANAVLKDEIEVREQTEADLRYQEELVRGIIDAAPFGAHLYELKPNGRLVFTGANPSADRILGVSHQQFIGKTIEEAFPALTETVVPDASRRAAALGEPYETEQIDYDEQGIRGAFEVHAFQTGSNRMATFFRDITERKKAEEALKDSENRYRTLVGTSPDAIMLVGLDLTILMCNQRTAEMVGFERAEDLRGHYALGFVVPEERQAALVQLKSLLETEVVRDLQYMAVREDGTHLPIELSASLIKDAEGNPSAIIALVSDITERKRFENELRRLRRDWEDIFRSIGQPTMILGQDHRMIDVNDAMLNAIGMTREELLGRHCYEIVHGTDGPVDSCPLPRMLISKRLEMSEVAIESIGGIFLISCTPVLDDEGEIEKVIHVSTDVTKLKNTETALQRSVESLERTLEAAIQAVALTVGMRDEYTAGHQRRVAQLASAIAGEMGLSPEQIRAINLTAVVHDIGKIYVPAEILSKPGRLSEIEFSMMKGHCQIGYDILKTITFPWPIAEIVLQHHERFDGSGYPSGLSGNGILLEARIIAVADVVEAMASHRPYRPALGIDSAMGEIAAKRGTLYDPTAVDACLRVFEKGDFKFS